MESPDDSPLYLRRGIPELPRVYRAEHITSAFGVDRFRVRRESTRARLELPLPAHASISAREWQAGGVFSDGGQTASIEPRQARAVAEVSLRGKGNLGDKWGKRYDLITIRRDAGAA